MMRVAFVVFWAAVLSAAVYFATESLFYLASDEVDLTEPRTAGVLLHAAAALPLLLIAPIQFNGRFRAARPRVHRILGRVFLGASALGSISAVVLSLGYSNPGGRVPLFMFGVLWAVFAALSWIAAMRGDIAAHRAFAMRTFAIAFAFVWVRILRVFREPLLGFIHEDAMQDLTREWLSFVLPLLIVELWLSWLPMARRLFNPAKG